MLRRSWNPNHRRSVGVGRQLYLASVTLSLLALAGCGSNTADPGSSTTPPTASTTTQPSTPPDAVATTPLDAYRGMWRAYVEAIHIPPTFTGPIEASAFTGPLRKS